MPYRTMLPKIFHTRLSGLAVERSTTYTSDRCALPLERLVRPTTLCRGKYGCIHELLRRIHQVQNDEQHDGIYITAWTVSCVVS